MFDLYTAILIIRKNLIYFILITIIFNIYPAYLYFKYTYYSDVRILSTEIAPVNEIGLLPLRDFIDKVKNAQNLIEYGYSGLDIKNESDDEEIITYTPQNLLSLYYDTAISKESIISFLKKYNLEKNISQSNFKVNYITSNRIDPFTDKNQKTVIVSLKVPNLEYNNLLTEFVEHINILTIEKINEQLDISTNNLTNMTNNLKTILDAKKKEILEVKKIELEDNLLLLSNRLAETSDEINTTLQLLKNTMDKDDLNKFVEILMEFPNTEVVMGEDKLYSINDEIKKWIIANNKLDEFSSINELEFFSDRETFSKFISNKIIRDDIENLLHFQKLSFLVSSKNNLFFEEMKTAKELDIINQKIKNPTVYGLISEFDENYLTLVSVIQESLVKEKTIIGKALQIVNSVYTGINVKKLNLNFWYFVVSNFLVIFVIFTYIIIAYELKYKKIK